MIPFVRLKHGGLLLMMAIALFSCQSGREDNRQRLLPLLEAKGPNHVQIPVVGLHPFEHFPTRLVDTVAKAIHSQLGLRTVVLPGSPLPQHAFTQQKSPRFRADTLIRWLRAHRPDSIDFILGLTQKDISTTKRAPDGSIREPAWKYEDWGIFGLGFRPGPSSIVSTFRLSRNDPGLLEARLRKVSVHEVGHNLGLPHCPNKGCVMEDAAETILTVDRVGFGLCNHCRQKTGIVPGSN